MRVCGIEIEPERVRAATALERPGLSFQVGGFELPVPGRPVLVRAFNVLRQYEEADVPGSGGWCRTGWRRRGCSSTAPATRSAAGPPGWRWTPASRCRLSFSVRFGSFEMPSDVAERLPKALIHRNVPGEPVHAFLQAMDKAWLEAAPLASFGNRQRWLGMCRSLRDGGWPVQDGPARWRLGELTVAWDAVAPLPVPPVGSPGAVGAHVAVAAAACVLDGGTDIGQVDGGRRHGREAEEAQGAEDPAAAAEQRDHAHQGGAAGEGEPEGLGPLGGGLEGVGAVPQAVHEGPQLEAKGHQRQDEEHCLVTQARS